MCIFYYNHFGDNCNYITFKNEKSTGPVTYYNFVTGLNAITIEAEVCRDYETKVEKDSNGNLKIFCLADLIYSGSDNSQPSYPYSTYFIGDI